MDVGGSPDQDVVDGSTPASPLLRMRAVAKSFGGVHALRGADLDVRRGEVHALLGQNGAGKSTLVNILSGVYVDYDGEVRIDDRPVVFASPAEAQAAGVATIHQELDLVPEMTVAENLFLGREPRTRWGTCDRRRMDREAGDLLGTAGVDLDPRRRVSSLRVGERQLVEVAKALSHEARVVIMDEPTSALADTEVRRLFEVVRELRRSGVSVIYISHRLEELAEIADRATVMRDGTVVGTVDVAVTPSSTLIEMMVGRPMDQMFPATTRAPGEPLLVLDRLTLTPRRAAEGRRDPQGVSLTVHEGEIVGLAGLMGSGRTELLEALYGVGPAGTRTGEARLSGEPLPMAGPRSSIAAGVALVTEDRKVSGLALGQSVRSNMTLAALGRVSTAGVVRPAAERRTVARLTEQLRLKTSSQTAAVGTLSGGNQQKVVFGRQLMTEPRLLLLDEPTRGVDVGAKAEIYRLLADLADQGIAILMASSELPELLGLCHRVVVLHQGRVTADLVSADTDQHQVLAAATTPSSDLRESA